MMTKSDVQLVAEYDQATVTISQYWTELTDADLNRLHKVVIPFLEQKGDNIAAGLLKWAMLSLKVKEIENKNRVEDY